MDTNTHPATDAVAAAVWAINDAENAGERAPTLRDLARAAHVGESTLRRAFVAATGLTPKGYADARRSARLRAALADGTPVTDAIHAAGFGSPSRVYERNGALLGMTPAAYRRGGPGETLDYAITDTTLGRLVVAMTERGVSMVAFGDTDDGLLADVSRRFPRADLRPAGARRRAWVETVVALAEHPGGAVSLPLDVRGTAFQQCVWAALREIPGGETITYSELARRIGRPSAARAVAAACGANPIALAIPCHRVIGADGSLTGYRWGVDRKRELLERERG